MSFNRRFRGYANETSIHGFKELFVYKSLLFRVTWSMVILGMQLSFGFELFKVIDKYMKEPTVTSVTYSKKEHFPEFSLCSNDWLNPTKAEALGFDTTAAKRFMLGSICPSVKRPSNLQEDFNKILPNNKTELILNLFDSETTKHGSYIELLRAQAFTYEGDLNGSVTCPPCLNKNIASTIFVKDVGPCWKFNAGALAPPTNRMTTYPYLEMTLNYPPGSPFNERSLFFMYFGSAGTSPSSPEDVYLTPYTSNFVDVNFVVKKRVSQCNPDTQHVDANCDAECFDAIAKACDFNCTVFMGEQYNRSGPNDRLCNWQWSKDRSANWTCFFGSSNMCQGCKKQCNRLEATTTASLRPKPAQHDMHIRIRLKNLYSIFEFEEYYSYTLTDLLGDFGGLLGLFLGASVISMAHTMYFCFIMPFTRIKSVEDADEEPSEKSTEAVHGETRKN